MVYMMMVVYVCAGIWLCCLLTCNGFLLLTCDKFVTDFLLTCDWFLLLTCDQLLLTCDYFLLLTCDHFVTDYYWLVTTLWLTFNWLLTDLSLSSSVICVTWIMWQETFSCVWCDICVSVTQCDNKLHMCDICDIIFKI